MRSNIYNIECVIWNRFLRTSGIAIRARFVSIEIEGHFKKVGIAK